MKKFNLTTLYKNALWNNQGLENCAKSGNDAAAAFKKWRDESAAEYIRRGGKKRFPWMEGNA